MIHTVRIPANHAAVIPVQINGNTGPLLLKPDPALTEMLDIGDSLLQLKDGDTTAITVLNHSDSTCVLQKGEKIGTVCKDSVIGSYKEDDESLLGIDSETDSEIASISTVSVTLSNNDIDELPYCEYSTERLKWRKQQLKTLCGSSPQLSPGENGQLCQLLCDYHDIFSLEEGE